MKQTRWGWAAGALAGAFVLLALTEGAQAGRLGVGAAAGTSPSPEAPKGVHLFGQLDASTVDHFLGRKRGMGEATAQKQDGDSGEEDAEAQEEGEEGEHKETIAHILDEALKEEFKKEEEKKEEVGKQFNETVASSEGTQETVVIISSSTKKKGNTTAKAEAAAAAEEEKAASEKNGSSSPATTTSPSKEASTAHPWHVAGGTGSLGGGVALAGGAHTGGGGGGIETDATGGEGGVAKEEAAVAAAERKAEKEERKKELEEKIEAASEADVDRIIDSKDNEYVLSKPSDEAMGMNLDPQFVKDLTVLVAASAAAGLVMGALGQPTINGYFIAGSIVGPGGLKLIKEIVQVQSVAQLGVQLLLFTLGLEFSMSKLRAVRNVALLGGLLQTALFAVLAGLGAKLIGTSAAQGAFVGALVAMSSTSIVIKVLGDYRSTNTQQGQITIGTLILQDCLVGVLFAFMPVLASAAGGSGFDISLLITVMSRVAGKLAVLAVGALVVARTVLPPTTRWLARRFGADSFQLAAIAFCLLCALATARQGVSAELGAFVAGVMLSATEQQEAVLHHLEPVTQFFLALFISSTGLVLSPIFLLHHLPLLAAGASIVILSKTCLIASVVKAFGYPGATALAVGLNLSQIGEFVFVLLSMANQQSLLADNVYMLLMGVTAFTLLLTPFVLQISNRFVLPKARTGYPNGPSAGDLEMAGPGSPGGSPSKRRPSAGSEPLKESPSSDLLLSPLTAEGGPASRMASPHQSAELLGSSLNVHSHAVPPGWHKLGQRGAAHRMVQVLAHGSGGGMPPLELSPSSGGGVAKQSALDIGLISPRLTAGGGQR